VSAGGRRELSPFAFPRPRRIRINARDHCGSLEASHPDPRSKARSPFRNSGNREFEREIPTDDDR